MNLHQISLKTLSIPTRQLNLLYNVGIKSIYDLLFCFPKRYQNLTLTNFNDIIDNATITIRAKIISNPLIINFKNNKKALSFDVISFDHPFRIVIFGQIYLQNKIHFDQDIYLHGKYHLKYNQIFVSKVYFANEYKNFLAIYNIKGINDKNLNNYILDAYNLYKEYIIDDLPADLISKYQLSSIQESIYYAHFATSKEELKRYFRRLKYEELLKFSLKLLSINQEKESIKKNPKKYDIIKLKEVINNISFELTVDQKNAVNEVCRQLKSEHLMNMLIQGDVGSGKTIVGLLASYACVTAGYQVAFMAPTEVLATQHFKNFTKFLTSYANVDLLISSLKKKEKDIVLEKLKNNQIDIIVGTHSLFQEQVIFNNLGLVVIDEQHRFGVNQRASLINKGDEIDCLYLTATPIPRTLTKTMFFDLDIVTIKSKPLGRKKIGTEIFNMSQLDNVLNFINTEIKKGHQGYIVLPFIESEEYLDCLKLSKYIMRKYPNINTEILTGKVKNEDKEQIMQDFLHKEIHLLIATTVIEVGIDNPNASFIVICHAERFGLSQLHQLRGRVGRGNLQSYCFLLSTKEDIKRLNIMKNVDDGFILSEEDLKMRGPGEFFGFRQSGLPEFMYSKFDKDYKILEIARQDAKNILNNPLDDKNKNLFIYLKHFKKNENID